MRIIITQALADSVETAFKKNIASFVASLNLGVSPVSIGGKFNKDGILLEIGLMVEGVSPDDVTAFIVDKQNGDSDIQPLVSKNKFSAKKWSKRIVVSEDTINKWVKALPSKYVAGDEYVGKKNSYTLLGYSKKRVGFVVANDNYETTIITEKKLKALNKV